MVKNEKALSELELEVLNLLRENPGAYISSPMLYGYYNFVDHDFDRILRKLDNLDFAICELGFPASEDEPAFFITQAGREYLHVQSELFEQEDVKLQQSREERKQQTATMKNNIFWTLVGAVLASFLSIFAPEIRAFLGLA